MTKINLAPGLVLPVEAAGETFLIVGKRGSGKSSTATRFAEQLVRAKVPIAVLDPVDVWWGLKAGGDGKRAGGLEVYIFGGDHADLPLESTAGSLLADVVVDHRVNVVMVLRAFSGREKARFVSDFAEQLYKRNRDTMHLFCEEAHEVMPQNPYGGEEEMLGRMLRLEKQGRTSGIGMTAITQRPASLNKNATTQAEILVAHRILGAQDVKAIDGWIEHHHQQDQRKEVLSTLAQLKTGEAWVWAPDFPEDHPVGLKRVQVAMPETFDSRRTPKPGERRTQPKELAAVDLEKLRTKMAATIERAKGEDPKALRARITELEKLVKAGDIQLRGRALMTEKRIEIPVLKNGALTKLDLAVSKMLKIAERMESVGVSVREAAKPVFHELERVKVASNGALSGKDGSPAARSGAAQPQGARYGSDSAPVRAATPRPTRPSTAQPASVRSGESRDTDLGRAERAILQVLAQYDAEGCTAGKLTLLTGYRYSGGFKNSLSNLRQRGYLIGPNTGVMSITGLAYQDYGPFDALPHGAALIDFWLNHRSFGIAEKKILGELVDAHPKGLTADQLTERTGYQYSGGFKNALSNLRTAGVLVGRNTEAMTASETLFEGVAV